MSAPVRIGRLDAEEAGDLVQALAARGLIGTASPAGRHRWVDVRDPHEETRRLLSDVVAAVETWLAEHDRRSLEVRVGTDVHRVLRPDTLPDALHARATDAARHGR